MRLREILGPVVAALAYHALYGAILLAGAQGDTTVFLCVGADAPLPAGVGEPVRFEHSSGYDGQFTALVALDPFDRRGTSSHLDDPGKRFGRILLPWIVGLAGAADLRQAAWLLFALNAIAAAAVAAVVVSLAPPGSGRGLAAVAAAIQPGLAVAVSRCTPGALGLALVLGALALRRAGHVRKAAALLALAALDQEIFALIPVAIAAEGVLRCRPSRLGWLLALAPASLWRLQLVLRGFQGAIPSGDLGLPGVGILESVLSSTSEQSFLPQSIYEIVHAACFVLLPVSLVRRSSSVPETCFAAVWCAAVCADRDVWIAFWSATRATSPAFALAACRGGVAGRAAVVGASLFSPFLLIWFALYPPQLV